MSAYNYTPNGDYNHKALMNHIIQINEKAANFIDEKSTATIDDFMYINTLVQISKNYQNLLEEKLIILSNGIDALNEDMKRTDKQINDILGDTNKSMVLFLKESTPYMSIPIGTNGVSNMHSNTNSDFSRTPIPVLLEQLASIHRIIAQPFLFVKHFDFCA